MDFKLFRVSDNWHQGCCDPTSSGSFGEFSSILKQKRELQSQPNTSMFASRSCIIYDYSGVLFEFELLCDWVDVWEVSQGLAQTDEEAEGAAQTGGHNHDVVQQPDPDAPHQHDHPSVSHVQSQLPLNTSTSGGLV